MLPVGRLREPLSSIQRANLVVFIKKLPNDIAIKKELVPILNAHQISHLDCDVQSVLYKHNYTNNALDTIDDTCAIKKPVVALAGIGNPAPFMHTIDNMFDNIVLKRALADHYDYKKNSSEIFNILQNVNQDGVALVTTLKDYIKIIGLPFIQNTNCEIYVLDINLSINDEDLFLKKILRKG